MRIACPLSGRRSRGGSAFDPVDWQPLTVDGPSGHKRETSILQFASGVLRSLFRSRRKPEAPESEPLDEHGFPWSWRRNPPEAVFLRGTDQAWEAFEEWCRGRNRRAFPATVETIIELLQDPPVQGSALFDLVHAIAGRHEAYYWHMDANPVHVLRWGRRGIYVESDGTVVYPISESGVS